MPCFILKALSPTLPRKLKARAALHKRSLNQETIVSLELAVAPSQPVDINAALSRTRSLRDRLDVRATAREIQDFKTTGRR